MVGKEHSRESERNHEWCSLAPSLASFYTFWKLSKFKLLKGDKLVEHGEVRRLAAILQKIFLDDINFSRKNMIGGKLMRISSPVNTLKLRLTVLGKFIHMAN